MKYFTILCSLTLCGTLAQAVEPGSFELQETEGRYTLEAVEAPVSAILTQLAETSGTAIGVDESDTSTVTLSLDDVSLEKLVTNVSEGYAMIFTFDEATGEYVVDRVVAAGNADPLSPESLASDEMDVKAVVKALQNKARNVKRFSQAMSMSMDMMGQQMTFDGKIWMDGDRMRMEMTIPPTGMEQLIVSDGDTTYIHMPMMNMVQSMDNKRLEEALGPEYEGTSAAQPGGNADPFQGLDEDTLQYSGTEMVDGEKMFLLEGALDEKVKAIMGASMPTPEEVEFWLSAEDGLPRKVIFYGENGNEMLSQSFKDVVVNPTFDENLFNFEVPEGAQVMDITEMAIGMHNAMKTGGGSGTKADGGSGTKAE